VADNLVLRRLLWALTSIVLIVGVLAIPVVGDDDGRPTPTGTVSEGDGRGVAASTIPSGSGGGGEGGEGDGAGTASTVAGGPSATGSVPTTSVPEAITVPAPTSSTPPATFPPPSTDLGAPQDPGAPVAPRQGLYRYRTTGGEGEGESTVRVVEHGRGGGEVRLGVTVASSQATITNEETWRAEGVRTLRSTFAFGPQSADCDWEPDVVDQVFPLRAGATWSSDSSCTITAGGITAVVHRTSHAEVVDLRRVRIDGTIVDVWAIRRVEQLSGAGQSGDSTALALFSPKYGIDVDVQGSATGGGTSGDYHQELLHLDPEV
jgi:hypothetical protein